MTGDQGHDRFEKGAHAAAPWEASRAWLEGVDHDGVVALDVEVGPTGAREAVWRRLTSAPGRSADGDVLGVGGAAVQRRPRGFHVVSGGEDGIDSLQWAAELIAEAMAGTPGVTVRWREVPHEEARPLTQRLSSNGAEPSQSPSGDVRGKTGSEPASPA